MAVCSHRNQVNLLLAGNPDDLVGGFTVGEDVICLNVIGAQGFGEVGKVVAITPHLVRFAKFELIEIAGHPTVGDANQQEFCSR